MLGYVPGAKVLRAPTCRIQLHAAMADIHVLSTFNWDTIVRNTGTISCPPAGYSTI